uniref:Putative transposase (Putative), gypsy type n=1 Tax=Tanacetum cinerariifolium TaxID=118510 RepID=A0A6L2L557_TANCI|nr:putative transposase (putative), gypsy type [Tanacetum cinerariifolium]
MATNTIDIITSILTLKELYAFCSTFNIPTDLRPEFPGPNDTIKDSSEGKIGINTRCIKFDNFRILLSKFILCVFQYNQINFSKLPILAATKISRFEIMYRVLGSAPTVVTFRRFYFNSISNGWLSFSKRSSTRCFSKNFDSLMNWNNHFFWIDASVCLIFVLWYNDVSVERDPLPSDDVVDLPLVEELNENRILIRKYPEVFLLIIGLSRTFVDTDMRPTLIGCDKNGRCWFTYVSIPVVAYSLFFNSVLTIFIFLNMGLLDFVKSADPFKVKLVDHTIMDESREADGKKKRKVGFSACPPPLKKARAGGIAILEPNPTTAGKTLAALKTLGIQGQHDVISPIQYVHIKAEVAIFSPVNETGASYIPWNEFEASSSPPNDGSPIDDFYDDVDFLDLLNVNSAQHVCMMSESRLQYEHEITIRERFEKKFVKSYETVQQRDAKIATLRSKLEKAEGKATDVIMLCRRVSELETAAAAKAEELAVLSVQDIELLGKVSGLKSVSDELKCQVSKLEADCKGLCGEIAGEAKMRAEFMWMIGHGLCLAVMKCSQSTEYHDALGKSIYMAINKGIQEGLEAGVEHGKAGRSLAELEAYDSGFEGGYASAVNELENVSFSLLDQLEAPNDSPLELVMSSLTLEGDHAASHAYSEKRKKSDLLSLETGGPFIVMPSASSQETSLVITDYQISTVTIVDGTAPATEPYDDLFDTNENPIRTLGDYSEPSHEGYRNTIELPIGYNVVPLRSDTIRDFAKLVNVIALPKDVPSTSDRRLIELENQVQCLMEAHLAPTQPTQVNKITTSCEICSGPHDTKYCIKDPEQAFVEYASSRTDEAGGARTSYYARKDFLDCHLPGEWEITRDVELNPLQDTLVFRRMVEFLRAIPINLKSNMWESEDLIKTPINWDNPSKNEDGTWHAKIRLIDLYGDEFTKTLQANPTTRKLFERESPRKIIDLDHFYDT